MHIYSKKSNNYAPCKNFVHLDAKFDFFEKYFFKLCNFSFTKHLILFDHDTIVQYYILKQFNNHLY